MYKAIQLIILIHLLFLIPSKIISQKTKTYFIDRSHKRVNESKAVYSRSVIKENKKWYVTDSYLNGNIRMKGAFLDSSLKKKTNIYTIYYLNGFLKSKGNYVNDSKHGKWEWFSYDGSIKAIGEYDMGKATGTWIWYDEEGNQTNIIENANDSIIKKNLVQASFPGGMNTLNKYIKDLGKPYTSIKSKLIGKTYTSFMIDKNGQVDNIEIIIHGSPAMDSLVIDKLKKMPKWMPALKFGKPIDKWFFLPVSFVAQNQNKIYVDDKKIALGFYYSGISNFKLDKFKIAEQKFKSAINHSNQDARFYNALALTYLKQKKYKLACTFFDISNILDKEIVSDKIKKACNL